jgi:hypothetical protein
MGNVSTHCLDTDLAMGEGRKKVCLDLAITELIECLCLAHIPIPS